MRRILSADVKVSFKLSNLTPLYSKWIVELYHHLNLPKQKKYIVKEVERAGIIKQSLQLTTLWRNRKAHLMNIQNQKNENTQYGGAALCLYKTCCALILFCSGIRASLKKKRFIFLLGHHIKSSS